MLLTSVVSVCCGPRRRLPHHPPHHLCWCTLQSCCCSCHRSRCRVRVSMTVGTCVTAFIAVWVAAHVIPCTGMFVGFCRWHAHHDLHHHLCRHSRHCSICCRPHHIQCGGGHQWCPQGPQGKAPVRVHGFVMPAYCFDDCDAARRGCCARRRSLASPLFTYAAARSRYRSLALPLARVASPCARGSCRSLLSAFFGAGGMSSTWFVFVLDFCFCVCKGIRSSNQGHKSHSLRCQPVCTAAKGAQPSRQLSGIAALAALTSPLVKHRHC